MTNWKTGTCKANGVEIHYLRTGGKKPSLLLLHGLMGSGACWTPVARMLQADYDVVMPDARGHGTSETPTHGYRYEDFASDVLGLMQGLGLDRPVLVGHSMGGLTAAVVASRLGHALRGLVLADPTFLTPERQREVYESDVFEQQLRFLNLSELEAVDDGRRRHPHRTEEIVKLVAQARLKTRMDALEVMKPPNPDYSELIAELDVSTLLVTADNGVVSQELARDVQKLNSRVTVRQIQEAGHGLHFDQPELFEAAIKPFLSSVTATRL